MIVKIWERRKRDMVVTMKENGEFIPELSN